MSSRVDLKDLDPVGYADGSEVFKEEQLPGAHVQIANGSHPPLSSSESDSDSGFVVIASSDSEVEGSEKVKTATSPLFPKAMEEEEKDSPLAKPGVKSIKEDVTEALESIIDDPMYTEFIMDTRKEPKATRKSWNETKKTITQYEDPVPPVPGGKKRPPVMISKQSIKDMERPLTRLEIEGKVYENPIGKKTTQEFAEENKDYIHLFQRDSTTREENEQTVVINGKTIEIDSGKLTDFVSKKYTYESARELTQKYGKDAAQLILFGFHQGHWVRDGALGMAFNQKLGEKYVDADGITSKDAWPLEIRTNNGLKIEVKRNLLGQIRKFRFKFEARSEFVKKGKDKPEVEVVLGFQFHVYNRLTRYQFANYSVDD